MSTGITPIFGRPGIGSRLTAQRRNVSRNGALDFYPAGAVIDGDKARDSGNTDDTRALRAGLLMGKATSGGLWSNSILGVLQGAAAAAAVSVTVTAAQATEIVRRIGSTGTLRFVGPPGAAGTVATFTETYSAVNTTTGVITVSALDAALIAGSFVCADDGTHEPKSFIEDGYGYVIPDTDADIEWPRVPVAGTLDVDQIIDWPSDSSLKTWVREKLSTLAGGKFIFSDQF